MAESDPTFDGPVAEVASPSRERWRHVRRIALMASVPLVLAIGAYFYYKSTENIITTDNAYVQQDKVSVSAEVTGEITEVLVRENQTVRAGDLLFRIDAEPIASRWRRPMPP